MEKKIFCIEKETDFFIIPNDTEILKLNYTDYHSQEIKNIFQNLPVLLEEIHFNNDKYIFNDEYNTNEKIEIKIPFGCKIFKFYEVIKANNN